jgi:hypothetical protein
MKAKLVFLLIMSGLIFSACKKDKDEIKEPIFENGKLNLNAFAASLPPYARVIVDHPSEWPDAYFNVDLSNASKLDGKWPGWCVETGVAIKPGNINTARVFSSFDENAGYNKVFMNRLNWIINQKFVEQGFTYGEVQIVLWTLKHGYNSFNDAAAAELHETSPPDLFDPKSIGDWNKEKVNEILTLATGISDFIPGYGGVIAILFVSEDNQDIIIEYTLPGE